MKEKVFKHYQGLNPRYFVVGTVIVLIILDLLTGLYLKEAWSKKDMAEVLLQFSINASKLEAQDLSNQTRLELAGLMNKTLDFMLFLILLNNLFFYFFYLRKKLWAQGYILFYTLTGALMGLLFMFDANGMGAGWLMVNLLTIPVYLYMFFGVKILKDVTTLAPEKKGR